MAKARPRLTSDEMEALREFRLSKMAQKLRDKTEPNTPSVPVASAAGPFGGSVSGPFEAGYDERAEPVAIRAESLGIMNDLHIPVHDVEACNLAASYLKRANIDTLILNGDVVDMYSLTRHGKDSRKYGLQYELNTARRELAALRKFFGDRVKIYYVEGNHEQWWKRYMRNIARELDEYQSLADTLKLREFGIEYVDNGMGIQCGKLRVIHGHEISGSGIYVAKRKLDKAKTNITFGHHHTSQEWTQTDIHGSQLGAWAVGCLCQRTPEWNRFSGYTLGFAHVMFNNSGAFEFHNKRIISGVVR